MDEQKHTPMQWISPWQSRGHKVEVCDASSGHSVHPVAYCDTADRANFIRRAANSHGMLVATLQALRPHVAVCDIATIDAALKLAEES